MQTKIGLVGVGHLGKIHLSCIQQVERLSLVGFFDDDAKTAKEISETTGVLRFSSLEALIEATDAIDIVTPTSTHFQIARQAICAGKHIFIEKPVTALPAEALELKLLQHTYKVVIQVGHVERFNPAMLAIQNVDLNPRFIEVHRLANFNPRGTDVSVVLDLMIHDLDIILSMVPSKIKSIMASGVALVSATADIGNARLEWENGCVANVTASRMSLKNMRKMRLFQPDAYISVDFLERNAQIIRLSDTPIENPNGELNIFELDTPRGKKTIQIEMPEIKSVNAIEMELESFAKSIQEGVPPEVGIDEASEALSLAFKISDLIDENMDKHFS